MYNTKMYNRVTRDAGTVDRNRKEPRKAEMRTAIPQCAR
jgi:hypothetical protein